MARGKSWATFVPKDPLAAGEDSHQSFAEQDKD